jgi:hypothetical protein
MLFCVSFFCFGCFWAAFGPYWGGSRQIEKAECGTALGFFVQDLFKIKAKQVGKRGGVKQIFSDFRFDGVDAVLAYLSAHVGADQLFGVIDGHVGLILLLASTDLYASAFRHGFDNRAMDGGVGLLVFRQNIKQTSVTE